MANYDGLFSKPSYEHILRLVVNQAGQDIAGNYSVDSWALYAIKNTSFGGYSANPNPWAVNINGQVWSGTFGFNFSGQPIGYTILIASGTTAAIGHNPDGTKGTPVSASANTTVLGNASTGGTFTQTPIPRASTPTFSDSTPDAGDTITITTNRASSGFTHTIEYNFNGAGWNTIGTGIGANMTWAIPLSLLTAMTAAPSATASIRTTTYNGATLIGTTTTSLVISAGASIVPDFTTVTHSEATSGLAANVGAYVQALTTLNLAITGAVGIYGSTITAYKIEVVGQAGNVVNAVSGVTPQALAASGTITLRGTVTDSRSRTHSEDVTITVLSYLPPQITAISAERALSDGTPDPDDGTYARININAFVQSLVVASTQKNALVYKIYSRLFGAGTWTLRNTVTPGGVTFNSYALISGILLNQSYDVKVEIIDDFSTTAWQTTIAVGLVFMDWDGAAGVGIRKYREDGVLDVGGMIFQDFGFEVLDERDLLDINADLDELDLRLDAFPTFSLRIPLPLSQTIRPNFGYTWANPRDPYVPFWLTRSSAGVVTIDGVGAGIAVAANVVLAVLPAGYRPSRELSFQCAFNGGRSSVTIKANGEISIGGAIVASDYFALSNVKFVASGYEATTFAIPWTPLVMQNSWLADATHVPQYAVDIYGCVWLRGKVSKAGTWTDSQTIASLPSTYNKIQAIYNVFCTTYNTMRYGLSGGGVGSNIMVGATVAGGAMTLDGVLIVPDAIYAGNYTRVGTNPTHPMGTIPFTGTWTNYNIASFTSAGIWKRPDGLVIPSGLIMSGSLGTAAFQVPAGARPFQTQVFENSATMSVGQTTVYAPNGSLAPGSFVPVVGAASYISPEGIAWNAGN